MDAAVSAVWAALPTPRITSPSDESFFHFPQTFEQMSPQEDIPDLLLPSIFMRYNGNKWVNTRFRIAEFFMVFESSEMSPSTLSVPRYSVFCIRPCCHPEATGDGAHSFEIVLRDFRTIAVSLDEHWNQVMNVLGRQFPSERSYLTAFTAHQMLSSRTANWWAFDPVAEFKRQGALDAKWWRLTHVNTDLDVCTTYGPLLMVPATLSDEEVVKGSKSRSKDRLLTLTYYCSEHSTGLVRAAQPCNGILSFAQGSADEFTDAVRRASPRNHELFVLDARPRANATAQLASMRGGFEPSRPGQVEVVFAGCENIHAIQDSYGRLLNLVTCPGELPKNFWSYGDAVAKTGWLKHVFDVVSGAVRVVRVMTDAKGPRNVVVNCSDGWDRTSQVCALAQIILDPYFRTVEGLRVVLEKDWLYFGHMFRTRGGRLGTDGSSPVFQLFMDCLSQMVSDMPDRFEYTQDMLIFIADARNSHVFGNFLCDSYRNIKVDNPWVEKATPSLFEAMMSFPSECCMYNQNFLPYQGVLPYEVHPACITLWKEFYLRHQVPHLARPPVPPFDSRSRCSTPHTSVDVGSSSPNEGSDTVYIRSPVRDHPNGEDEMPPSEAAHQAVGPAASTTPSPATSLTTLPPLRIHADPHATPTSKDPPQPQYDAVMGDGLVSRGPASAVGPRRGSSTPPHRVGPGSASSSVAGRSPVRSPVKASPLRPSPARPIVRPTGNREHPPSVLSATVDMCDWE